MNFISLLFYFYAYDSIYFYEYDEPAICMIVLVALVDVRHRMHSLHLQNIQVHKINTTSNSQGVIDPSRYFYFYNINDSNNPIEYSIYIIIKLLTKIFFPINLYELNGAIITCTFFDMPIYQFDTTNTST